MDNREFALAILDEEPIRQVLGKSSWGEGEKMRREKINPALLPLYDRIIFLDSQGKTIPEIAEILRAENE